MNAVLEQINTTEQRFVEYAFTALIQSSLLIAIFLPLEVTEKNFIGNKVSGILGTGDNKIELRTQVGSITIR